MPNQHSHTSVPEELRQDAIAKKLQALDQHFNPDYSESLIKNVIDPINNRYFKCEFIGFDKLPQRNNPQRPLIYA